jgi:OOP family OmpA-OmpF porin
MRPKTNRLLMLLVGAAVSGCASQTDRSSSGGGDRYQPEKEAVQIVDRPLPDTPPPKPAPVAVAPKAEPTPDFPVTKYELPQDQATDDEIEDLGAQEDESVSAEQDALAAGESSVGETTEYAEDEEVAEEIEELGPQEDESVSAQQDALAAGESSVGETTEYAEEEEVAEEIEELGPQEDESVSAQQDALAAAGSSVGETTQYAQEEEVEVVEDLGTQPDDSGTVHYAEEKRAADGNVVGEPKIYADEPAPQTAPAAPKKDKPATPKTFSVTFEAEPLFNFDRSEIRADQRAKLDEFISGLGDAQYVSIAVVGHADRIGTKAYNQKLSERRAEAVRAYMVRKGVQASKIQTEGRGETDSVAGDTCNKTSGKALISCLQPDRRVDVSVSATKKAN